MPGVSYHPPSNDALCGRLMHVPLKAGQLVIWDSGSLHANFANKSSAMRVVQVRARAGAARVLAHSSASTVAS